MFTISARALTRAVVGSVSVALLAAAFATLAPVAPASAATCDTSWKTAVSGSWDTASNWSAGVPGSGSNACIKVAGTYTVTANGSHTVSSLTLGGTSGTQTLSIVGTCGSGNGILQLNANSSVAAHGEVDLSDTTGGSCSNQFAELYAASGTLTNAGTIHAIAGNTERWLAGNVTNTGTISIDANTLLQYESGTLANNAGTIAAAGGGTLQVEGYNSGNYTQGGGTTSGASTTPVLVVGGGLLSYTGAGTSTITQVGNATTLAGNIASGQTLNLRGDCVTGYAVVQTNADWTNGGTINLTDIVTGGCGNYYPELYMASGTLTNAGTIHAIAGNTERWLAGNVTNTGTISIDANTLLQYESGTLANNAGTIAAAGGATLQVEGYNSGNYTQGGGTTSGASTTPVFIIGGASLSYTGTGASTITQVGNATTLSGNIASGQTLNLRGDCNTGYAIVQANADWTNGGTINLSDITGGCGNYYPELYTTAGTLTNTGTIHVAPGNTERWLAGNVTNTGTISIAANTLLQYEAGTLADNAGAIAAASGATLQVEGYNSGNYTQGGGTTSGASTTPVLVVGGALAYTGTGASTITQVGNATTLSGNIASGQTLNLRGDCNTGYAIVQAGASWTNAGTINLTDITGGCGNYYPELYTTAGTLTNTGTIHVAAGNTERWLAGNVTNKGTISVDAATTAHYISGTLTNSAGTIAAAGTATVEVDSAAYTQGNGTTSGASTTPVLVIGGNLTYAGTGASTVTQVGNSTTLAGNIAASQTLTLRGDCNTGYAVVQAGASWTNKGTINLTDITGGCGNYFAQLYTSAGTFTNSGTIHVVAGNSDRYLTGAVMNKAKLVIDAGATLQANSGTLTNASTGTFEMHIASATSFGQILGSTPIKLGGTLSIVSSYTPALNATFPIITCSGSCETGKFATITGQSIAGGLAYAVTSKGTGTTLAVKKAADVSLTGSAPSPVTHGTSFSYTFTVHNAGPNTATATKLLDTLPANVTFVSGSPSCTAAGAKVTCSLGNIASGASVVVTITVTAGAPSTFTNTATVSATTVDVTPNDAKFSVPVTIT